MKYLVQMEFEVDVESPERATEVVRDEVVRPEIESVTMTVIDEEGNETSIEAY